MNMKKIIMVLISMALVFTMAGAVSAAESYADGGEATAQVKVSGDVFETLVLITFPTLIELTGEYDSYFAGYENITITKAKFGSKYTGVNITVTSTNNWYLYDANSEPAWKYQMGLKENMLIPDDPFINSPYDNGDTILTLTSPISESDDPYVVEYGFLIGYDVVDDFESDLTDTLTFTVNYIEAESTT